MRLERKIVILDEKNNLIKSHTLQEKEPIYINTPDVIKNLEKSYHKKVFDKVDGGVDVLIPYNNGEDFIIENGSFHTSEFAKLNNPNELFNKSYNKAFPYLEDAGFFDIIREVNKTGETHEIIFMYYIENQLISKFYKIIMKDKDKIYILIKRESDFNIIHQEGLDLFYNSPDPLVVVQDKRIVRVNKSAEKISGYNAHELIGKDYYFKNPLFKSEILNKEFDKVYDEILNRKIFNYTRILKFKNKKGEIVHSKVTIQPSTYNGKNAVLFNFIDISEGIQHEQQAHRLNEALNLVSEISKIAYMYFDSENAFIWSDEFFKIIEEKPENLNGDLINYVIDEDYDRLRKLNSYSYKNLTSHKTKTKIKTKSGIKDVEIYINSKKDSRGITKMVGYVQDITNHIKTENELKHLVDEKESLLGEVHHRVKNNLQIISSLIRLDSNINPNQPEKILESTQKRINNMAFVHEQIYQSPNHAHINLKDYILSLYYDLFSKNTNIKLKHDLTDVYLNMDTAIPLGIILSEIMHNTLTYAFPNNEKGIIKIKLNINENRLVTLTIEDNGIGLPENINIDNPTSLGLIVITNLTKQLEGSIKLLNLKNGTGYKITIPLTK